MRVKTLIIFNHEAPYKVKLFNELSKKLDLFVIFERKYASDRPKEFYSENVINFNHKVINKCTFGKENSFSHELKRFIKKNHNSYDLIVMNGYSMVCEQAAINYMIKKHIPYVLFINGGVIKEKENPIKRLLKKRYIKNAIGYLSPNDEANKYLKYYGATSTIVNYPYCTYFENNIKEANLSDEKRKSLRKKYDLPEGKIFISASNFIPRKNNFELFDCFKDEKYTLILYGNGPLKEKYDEYLKQKNIKNVIIRDFVHSSELMEIMSCCDCFITLSKEDIYGHTTIEALASGIPVISSEKVVSSVAVIKEGKNGYLVGTKEDVKKALKNVDYSAMSAECIKVAKNFSIEKEAEIISKGLEVFKK